MTSETKILSEMIVCHGCDFLMERRVVGVGRRTRCPRCDTVIHRTIGNSLEKTMALSLAGLILFVPAMYLPLMTFTVAGLHGSGNVLDAMLGLFEKGYFFVGAMVCLVSIARQSADNTTVTRLSLSAYLPMMETVCQQSS